MSIVIGCFWVLLLVEDWPCSVGGDFQIVIAGGPSRASSSQRSMSVCTVSRRTLWMSLVA